MLICFSFEIFVCVLWSSARPELSKVDPFRLGIVGRKNGADLGTFGGSLGLLRSYANKTGGAY